MIFMKHYDAVKVEEKIRKFWEKEKIYKFDRSAKILFATFIKTCSD